MKIDINWTQEIEGTTEIDVPEAEVRAWLDDPVTGGERAGNVGDITAEDCYQWLTCGDDDVWTQEIDPQLDMTASRGFELDGLA